MFKFVDSTISLKNLALVGKATQMLVALTVMSGKEHIFKQVNHCHSTCWAISSACLFTHCKT